MPHKFDYPISQLKELINKPFNEEDGFQELRNNASIVVNEYADKQYRDKFKTQTTFKKIDLRSNKEKYSHVLSRTKQALLYFETRRKKELDELTVHIIPNAPRAVSQEKPWFKKPKYFVPFFGILLTGLITGGFQIVQSLVGRNDTPTSAETNSINTNAENVVHGNQFKADGDLTINQQIVDTTLKPKKEPAGNDSKQILYLEHFESTFFKMLDALDKKVDAIETDISIEKDNETVNVHVKGVQSFDAYDRIICNESGGINEYYIASNYYVNAEIEPPFHSYYMSLALILKYIEDSGFSEKQKLNYFNRVILPMTFKQKICLYYHIGNGVENSNEFDLIFRRIEKKYRLLRSLPKYDRISPSFNYNHLYDAGIYPDKIDQY